MARMLEDARTNHGEVTTRCWEYNPGVSVCLRDKGHKGDHEWTPHLNVFLHMTVQAVVVLSEENPVVTKLASSIVIPSGKVEI